MSRPHKDKKPYANDNYTHYDEAHQTDKSHLHTRGGSDDSTDRKPTTQDIDELYNESELNNQRNLRTETRRK